MTGPEFVSKKAQNADAEYQHLLFEQQVDVLSQTPPEPPEMLAPDDEAG